MDRIFVYGTLKRGYGNWNHFLNKPEVKFLGEDTLKGFTMVSLGGFPGVIYGGEGEIHGEVYEIPDDVSRSIDYLEGYPEFYTKMGVITKWGAADMYILPKAFLNNPVVESGNWEDQ